MQKIKVKKIYFIFLSRFSVLLHLDYTISLIPVNSYDIQLSIDV